MLKFTKEMITAGRAVFTVEPSLADRQKLGLRLHYVYRVNLPKRIKKDKAVRPYFVNFGRDSSSRYMGIMHPETGRLRLTGKSAFELNSWEVRIFERTTNRIFSDTVVEIEKAGWTLNHAGTCCRCGRELTVPASIQTGIGPECELMVMAGLVEFDQVPQTQFPEIARLQANYWMQGLEELIPMIRDAALDCNFSAHRAEAIAKLTKKSMRQFKQGKDWPADFSKVVGRIS